MSGGFNMSVIELILILVVLGGICSVVFRSSNHRHHNRRPSRIDWSKVTLVFLGIPFLIAVALGGTYFLSQSRAQQHVAVLRDQQHRERNQQLIAQVELEQRLRAEEDARSGVSQETRYVGPAEVLRFPAPAKEVTAEVIGTAQAPVLFIIVTLLGILGFIIGLILIARKNVFLAAGLVVSLVLMALVVGFASTVVRTTSSGTQQATAEASLPNSFELPLEPVQDQDLIPVGEDSEPEAVVPLQIRQVNYNFSHGKMSTSKTISKIPEWVSEANDQSVFRPAKDEIVLISKRYSTTEEAEAELRQVTSVIATNLITEAYPEMKSTWIDAESLLKSGVLIDACEITWPFQVGNFSDEMHQVAWKLHVTEPIQKRVYSKWQHDEVTQRLAILGGSLGVLTLIFGVGAILTRKRPAEKHDEEPA